MGHLRMNILRSIVCCHCACYSTVYLQFAPLVDILIICIASVISPLAVREKLAYLFIHCLLCLCAGRGDLLLTLVWLHCAWRYISIYIFCIVYINQHFGHWTYNKVADSLLNYYICSCCSMEDNSKIPANVDGSKGQTERQTSIKAEI